MFFVIYLGCSCALTYAQKTVAIAVLTDESSNQTQLIDLLESEINAVVGRKRTVDFGEVHSNNSDLGTSRANYQTLPDNDTDIILTY